MRQNPKFQSIPNYGPIPEGKWYIDVSKIDFKNHPGEWFWEPSVGNAWVPLRPDPSVELWGREGDTFDMHGSRQGNPYGSAGCVDLGEEEIIALSILDRYGAPEIELIVKYDDRLKENFHPVYLDRSITSQEKFDAYLENVEKNSETTGIEVEDLLEKLEPIDKQLCFLAGTVVAMADGAEKTIENLSVGDEVFAYDERDANGRAGLKPARVTQTFTNTVSTILDFHGLMVTPGHVTLCGDGPYEGQHRPLFDIIRDDGAVVDRDGNLIRAATNCPVGSDGDRFVEVAYTTDVNATAADLKRGRMRVGTLLLTDAGDTVSVLECLEREGYGLQPDGLVAKDGETPHPLYWFGDLPRPEDYVLKKSGLTLDDLYSDPDAITEPARLDAVTTAAWRDRTGARVSAEAASSPRRKAGNTLH